MKCNKRILIAALVSVSCSFIACSKGDSSSSPSSSPRPAVQNDELLGKPASEVLQIKYRKADLKCRMFNRNGAPGFHLNLQGTPDDSFVLDLVRDFSTDKTMVLKSETADHQFLVFEFKAQSIGVQNWSYDDYDSHTRSVMRYSPYVNYVYRITGQYLDPAGTATAISTANDISTATDISMPGAIATATHISGGQDFAEVRKVSERVNDVPLRYGITSADKTMLRAFYVDCSIDTELNPGFENQFSVIRF